MRLFTVVSNSYIAPSAGGAGWEANAFDFNNLGASESTNTVTFTDEGVLCISISEDANNSVSIRGYYNGQLVQWRGTPELAIESKQTGSYYTMAYGNYHAAIDISLDDTLYFTSQSDEPLATNYTISFYSNTFSGTLISNFTVTQAGCYLTTATVIYKNLQDDGPELTAMRTLREHFVGNIYYDNLLQEYYEVSPQIIQKINSSLTMDEEYEFIYQSVLKVKSFVEEERWEEAKEESLSTYIALKEKYIQA